MDKQTEFSSIEEAMLDKESVLVIDLSRKRYTDFPMEVLQFPNLKVLRLKKNKISKLPDISSLQALEVLDMRNNKLDSIHHSVYTLSNLKELRLGNNRIQVVDAEIGGLDALEYLDLWGNMLDRIPEEISNCQELRFLDLRVMEVNSKRQEELRNLLPRTKIFFSKPCNCMQDE